MNDGQISPNPNTLAAEAFEKFLASLRAEGRNFTEAQERECFGKMLSQAKDEADPEIRLFMLQTLEHYCGECSMLMSYIYETYWEKNIREQRKLKRDMEPVALFLELEEICANLCDTSGYTKMAGGRRYPLTVPGHYAGEKKVPNPHKELTRAGLRNSYYQLGVHKFRVGHAIHDLLAFLEERYGLNFEKLEKTYQAKN